MQWGEGPASFHGQVSCESKPMGPARGLGCETRGRCPGGGVRAQLYPRTVSGGVRRGGSGWKEHRIGCGTSGSYSSSSQMTSEK